MFQLCFAWPRCSSSQRPRKFFVSRTRLVPDILKIVEALNTFVDQFGDDVDHYLDFSHLMDSKSIVDAVRPIIEKRISYDFLPNFRFEDNQHASWFMKHYSSWPTWVSDYPIKPERWDDTWVRLIMVPNKHHYLAEIATNMQRKDQGYQTAIRSFNRIVKEGSKKDIRNAALVMKMYRGLAGLPPGPVKGERDLMAMKSWPHRLEEKFSDFDLPANDTSIMRLATKASGYRSKRIAATPPSGWQITDVIFFGKIENPDAPDPEKWAERNSFYREHWKWHPIDGVTCPKRTEFTLLEPAVPNFWARKWTKNKKVFRD